MLRRVLPAFAAAAVVLLPGVASAAPATAPAEPLRYQSYFAQGNALLSDGREVTAYVSEIPQMDGKGSDAGLALWVQPAVDCWQTTGDCESGTGLGYVSLIAGDIGFDRRLSGVSLSKVAVTLHRSDCCDPWGAGVDEPVVVDVVLTGTGARTHTADHGPTCGSGDLGCQSTRVGVQRSGETRVDLDGVAGSGLALLTFGKSIDVAVPHTASAGTD